MLFILYVCVGVCFVFLPSASSSLSPLRVFVKLFLYCMFSANRSVANRFLLATACCVLIVFIDDEFPILLLFHKEKLSCFFYTVFHIVIPTFFFFFL